MTRPSRFHPLDGSSFLLELESLAAVMGSAALLRGRRLPGVLDVVSAARTVLVRCDSPAAARQARAILSQGGPTPAASAAGTLHTFNTVYDGADLAEAAELAGLGAEALVRWHAGQEWVAAFGGFAPGFMYLSPVERALDIARKATPRTVVPAGSVAVGGGFSAIYPGPSPGGWQLLGRCAENLWDTTRAQPALVQPGDRIRFNPVRDVVQLHPAPVRKPAPTRTREPDPVRPTRLAQPASQMLAGRGGLEVLAPGIFTTVQDLGRPGYAHVGVAGSGALDRPALRRANRMVGNVPDSGPGAAGLEVVLGGLRLRAHGTAVLAVSGNSVRLTIYNGAGNPRSAPGNAPFLLVDGEVLDVGALPGPGALRSVVAVRGGVDAAPVLGSRSTDVLSGLGPPPLQTGTFLATGSCATGPAGFPEPSPPTPGPLSECTAEPTILRFVPGPRSSWFTAASLARFERLTWQVGAASNRIGLRLELPGAPAGGAAALPLERVPSRRAAELPSEGMVDGAVQVPPSGLPVVFLADHPVTGGYPVVGVVLAEDLPLAATLGPGAAVRFMRVD